MTDLIIFKNFGYKDEANEIPSFKDTICYIFENIIKSSYIKTTEATKNSYYGAYIFYYISLFVFKFQLIACIAEKADFLFVNEYNIDYYLYYLILNFKLNYIMKYSLVNAYIYLSITLVLTLIIIIMLIFYYKFQRYIDSLSYFMYFNLKLFEGFLFIPILDAALKTFYCHKNSYFYLESNGECKYNGYSNEHYNIIIIYVIITILSLILKFTTNCYLNNAIFFDYNQIEFRVDSNFEHTLTLLQIIILFINNSDVFSSSTSLHVYLLVTICLLIYTYLNFVRVKVYFISVFTKAYLFFFCFTLIISYYFYLKMIFVYYLFSIIFLYFVVKSVVNYRFNNLIYNKPISDLSSICEIFLVLDYLMKRVNSLSLPLSKAELQGYIYTQKQDIPELELLSNTRLHLPITDSWREDVLIMEIEDEVYLKNFITFFLEYCINQKAINNFNIYINLSYYVLIYTEHYVKSIFYLVKSKEKITNKQQYFTYKRVEKIIKQQLLKKVEKDNKQSYEIKYLDLTDYFKYECYRNLFIEKFNAFLSIYYLICLIIKSNSLIKQNKEEENLSFINSNECNDNNYEQENNKFNNIYKIIEKVYNKNKHKTTYNLNKQLAKISKDLNNIYLNMTNLNFAWCELWSLYEYFLNSTEYSLDTLSKLNNHIVQFEQLKKKELGKVPFNYLFSNNDAVSIVLSGDHNSLGKICYISSNCVRLFGYNSSDLLFMPIETLMPDIIGSRHKGYMNIFFNTGLKTLIDRTVTSFGITKEKHLFEASISVKILPFFDKLVYGGILQKRTNNSSFILIDNNFRIRNISKNLADIFDIKEAIFETENIPIFFISKELINLAFQQYENILKLNSKNINNNNIRLKVNEEENNLIAINSIKNHNLIMAESITLGLKDDLILNSNKLIKSTFFNSNRHNNDKNVLIKTESDKELFLNEKYSKNNFNNNLIYGFSKDFERKLKHDKLNNDIFKLCIDKIFDKGALVLMFNIYNQIRTINYVLSDKEQKDFDKTEVATDFIEFKNNGYILRDNEAFQQQINLKDSVKKEIEIINDYLTNGELENLFDSMNYLYNPEEETIYSKIHNDKRRKKGESMHFKLECKLSYSVLMDGYKMYVISIADDSFSEFIIKENTLTKSNDELTNVYNKIKIDKFHGYIDKIQDIETNFKLSKFKKTQLFYNEIEFINNNSNIYKLNLDIELYNVSQDSHSSNSQVLNKQVKYNRITTKLETLNHEFLNKRYYLYYFLSFLLFLYILSTSLLISSSYKIENNLISCNRLFLQSALILDLFMYSNIYFTLTKIAYDNEIKNYNSKINNLKEESLLNYIFKNDNLYKSFGYENNIIFFNDMKSKTVKYVSMSLESINKFEYSLLKNSNCFDTNYIYETYIKSNFYLSINEVENLKNIKNFKKDSETSFNKEYNNLNENPNSTKESYDLVIQSIYNTLMDIENILNDNNFNLNLSNNLDYNEINSMSNKIILNVKNNLLDIYIEKILQYIFNYNFKIKSLESIIFYSLCILCFSIVISIIFSYFFFKNLICNVKIRQEVIEKINDQTIKDMKYATIKTINSLTYINNSVKDQDYNILNNNLIISKHYSKSKDSKISRFKNTLNSKKIIDNYKTNLAISKEQEKSDFIVNIVKMAESTMSSSIKNIIYKIDNNIIPGYFNCIFTFFSLKFASFLILFFYILFEYEYKLKEIVSLVKFLVIDEVYLTRQYMNILTYTTFNSKSKNNEISDILANMPSFDNTLVKFKNLKFVFEDSTDYINLMYYNNICNYNVFLSHVLNKSILNNKYKDVDSKFNNVYTNTEYIQLCNTDIDTNSVGGFINFRTGIVNDLKFLNSYGLNYNEYVLKTTLINLSVVYTSINNMFINNFLIIILNKIVNKGLYIILMIFIISLLLVFIMYAFVIYYLKKKVKDTLLNISNILNIIPFKNKNDIEILDKYLNYIDIN